MALWVGAVEHVALAIPSSSAPTSAPSPSGSTASQFPVLLLRSQRTRDTVDIIIDGIGNTAQVASSPQGSRWIARITTSSPRSVPSGGQAITIANSVIQGAQIQGSGTSFSVQVDLQPGMRSPSASVSNNGSSLILSFPAAALNTLQSAQVDLTTPGQLPQPPYVPPMRPRAVAPPLGDMAVGSMVLRNRGFVQLSGPPVTITARGVAPRDLLMALAQLGGYGFAFSEADDGEKTNTAPAGPSSNSSASSDGQEAEAKSVTVSFRNENFARAFNFVLLSAGLQAKVEGRTILVGPNVLSKSIGSQLSKVYRLNQVSPDSAGDYLANLGAIVNKTNTTTITSSQGSSTATGGGAPVGGSTNSATTSETTKQTYIQAYGASSGPLIGLTAVSDARLGTITLVGDSALISIAEGYLRQLDLRTRQVAIEVRMINIDLGNQASIDNSVAYKSPNGSWFISEAGKGLYQTPGLPTPSGLPANSTPNNTYLQRLNATITSSSAKVLANPTLVVQEGNEASVESVISVITDITVAQTPANNTICSQTRQDAGLKLPLKVSKIDDNGFVTLNMKPSISVPQQAGEAVCGTSKFIVYNIVSRVLESGDIRLRDGQTLVLTGVIQDRNTSVVDKIPLLGDLPLVGQYFRGSRTDREKSELVILATPRIIRDDDGGTYGYGSTRSSL